MPAQTELETTAAAWRAARARLIVAIDVPDGDDAVRVLGPLADRVGVVKIGLELFVAEGPAIVSRVRERWPELDVFLDLKLHDIPNTMRGAIRSARRLGARYLTVHAASGVEHLRACADEAGDALHILAVTLLTSQDAASCRETGQDVDLERLIALRTRAASAAGCAGVVCSALEVARAAAQAPSLLRVVPGIRPGGQARGDQVRVATPAAAIAAGASHLVVGRPITTADDPPAAADAIVAEILQATIAAGLTNHAGA